MKRLGILSGLGLFVLAVSLALGPACREPPTKKHGPYRIRLPGFTLNVGSPKPQGLVFVTVDTLRADYLSSYGHSRILTPSIDQLAAGGILFRQAIAQSTTTTPSHASIFTGLYLQDHNVYSNFEALGNDPVTMAEILKEDGFKTFAMVNMRHLNPEIGNLAQGFDTYVRNGNMRRAGPTIDRFFEWLDQLESGDRYFAWIHLSDVHTPYRPPQPYNHFYYDDDERDPAKRSLARIWPLLPTHMSDHPFFQNWLDGITDLKWVLAQYQGAVTYVDDELGRLAEQLKERDLLDKTAITLTADHGESLGEHDMYFVHTGLYESTVHVPLIMYFPGSYRQGVEVHDVVETVDILPTVLEYFKIDNPTSVRGRSLWPAIHGEMMPERVALTEHAGANMVSLRSGHYKYIQHLKTKNLQPSYPFIAGKEELYDLRRDPFERRNLMGTKVEVARVLRKELTTRQSQALAHKTGEAELTDETVEVLRALGYVE